MKAILQNPYRIAGILANCSEKDLLKQKSKIKRFSEVGKEITSEYDFPFLPNLPRSTSSIDKAFSDIEQNQHKVIHSLFWFINLNPIDNTAIEYLKSGDKEKAIEIWEKLTEGKEVNTKKISAFNNIGTLYLLENSKEKIKQGITAKIKLIESESFKDFVNSVADETFSLDIKKQIELLIDELLTQLKNNYSIVEKMELFDNCNGLAKKYLSKKFTDGPIHNIETQTEKAKRKRDKNKEKAYQIGLRLHEATTNDFTLLKSILGVGNLQYKMLTDNVAKEILQCSIDYFNENQQLESNNNYHKEAMELAQLALAITTNESTKNQIKENINTLDGMKDNELNQAIEVLNIIKNSFDNNKAKIYTEVNSMPLGYNQSINWDKVNQMIENSLDWDKIVELVKEVISLGKIEKIKTSENHSKLTEYKSLVDFLLSKLNNHQKIQVKYICYWKTVHSVPSLSSKSISTQRSTTKHTSSDNEGCAPWLYWLIIIIVLIALVKACN